MVHDAGKAAQLTALAIAAVLACALAACGGGAKPAASGTTATTTATATAARASTFDASPFLATFSCRQWLVAGTRTRAAVLRALRGFYGAPVSGKRKTQAYGTVLSDAQALRLFDDTCHRPYAIAFTLYKLYARAAAFAGHAP